MSSQSAAQTLMTCLETCMLTEAELAAALRISARQVQRRAGGNPPDISASGAAWRSR